MYSFTLDSQRGGPLTCVIELMVEKEVKAVADENRRLRGRRASLAMVSSPSLSISFGSSVGSSSRTGPWGMTVMFGGPFSGSPPLAACDNALPWEAPR